MAVGLGVVPTLLVLAGLSVAAEESANSENAVSGKRACQWMASYSGVNVRTGPGTNYRSIAQHLM